MDSNKTGTTELLLAMGMLNRMAAALRHGLYPLSQCHAGNARLWGQSLVYMDETALRNNPSIRSCAADELLDVVYRFPDADPSRLPDPGVSWASQLSSLTGHECVVRAVVDGPYAPPTRVRVSFMDPDGRDVELVVDKNGWHDAG